MILTFLLALQGMENILCPGSKLSPKIRSLHLREAVHQEVLKGSCVPGRPALCTRKGHLPEEVAPMPPYSALYPGQTPLIDGDILSQWTRLRSPNLGTCRPLNTAHNPSALAWKIRLESSAYSVFLPGSHTDFGSSPGSRPPRASPMKSRTSPASPGWAPRGRRNRQTHICPSSSRSGRQTLCFQEQNGV